MLTDGVLQNEENVWNSTDAWEFITEDSVKIKNVDFEIFLSIDDNDIIINTTDSDNGIIWLKTDFDDGYFTLKLHPAIYDDSDTNMGLTATSNDKLEIAVIEGKLPTFLVPRDDFCPKAFFCKK